MRGRQHFIKRNNNPWLCCGRILLCKCAVSLSTFAVTRTNTFTNSFVLLHKKQQQVITNMLNKNGKHEIKQEGEANIFWTLHSSPPKLYPIVKLWVMFM